MRVLGATNLMMVMVVGALAGCGEGTDTALDALGLGSGGRTGDGSVAGTGGSGGGSDAGNIDTGAPAAGAFRWLAIVDSVGAPACTGTGPGADIDSVSLSRAGTALGVGLTGSTSWVEVFPGTSASPCSMCGSGGAACPNSGTTDAAGRVAGAKDARSYASMPDTGYASLNGGAVWLQIGSATGGGTAQDIKSGDKLTVWEVDKTYIADMSAFAECACAPEKYTVWAYVTMGDSTTRVQLTPTAYRSANTDCPATPDMNGCGTTDFMVP